MTRLRRLPNVLVRRRWTGTPDGLSTSTSQGHDHPPIRLEPSPRFTLLPCMSRRDRRPLATGMAAGIELCLPDPQAPARRHLPGMYPAATHSTACRLRRSAAGFLRQPRERGAGQECPAVPRRSARDRHTALPGHHPVIKAQTTINRLISVEPEVFGLYRDWQEPASRILADIRAIATRALAYGDTGDIEKLIPEDFFETYHAAMGNGIIRGETSRGLTSSALAAAPVPRPLRPGFSLPWKSSRRRTSTEAAPTAMAGQHNA